MTDPLYACGNGPPQVARAAIPLPAPVSLDARRRGRRAPCLPVRLRHLPLVRRAGDGSESRPPLRNAAAPGAARRQPGGARRVHGCREGDQPGARRKRSRVPVPSSPGQSRGARALSVARRAAARRLCRSVRRGDVCDRRAVHPLCRRGQVVWNRHGGDDRPRPDRAQSSRPRLHHGSLCPGRDCGSDSRLVLPAGGLRARRPRRGAAAGMASRPRSPNAPRGPRDRSHLGGRLGRRDSRRVPARHAGDPGVHGPVLADPRELLPATVPRRPATRSGSGTGFWSSSPTRRFSDTAGPPCTAA